MILGVLSRALRMFALMLVLVMAAAGLGTIVMLATYYTLIAL